MTSPPTPNPPTSTADAEAMLRSSAAGPPSFGDDDPWDFVLRWPEDVIANVAWPAISHLLEDDDPDVRARSISFVGVWRDGGQRTLDRLIEVATQRASLFRDAAQADELAIALAGKSASLPAQGPRVASAILALLSGAPPPKGAVTVLAEHEPSAVIQGATKWSHDSAGQAAAKGAAFAMAMYRRDDLLELLAALGARSLEQRTEILAEIEAPLALADDQLALILKTEGLPLPQTHPTLDDCRRALGLTSP